MPHSYNVYYLINYRKGLTQHELRKTCEYARNIKFYV